MKFTALLLICASLWGKNAHPWERGRVADLDASSSSYYAGSDSTYSNGSTHTTNRIRTIDSNLVVIEGETYGYIVEDATRHGGAVIPGLLANRKKGCRFIVNDSVDFWQNKKSLVVKDADGKTCKLPIKVQRRLK